MPVTPPIGLRAGHGHRRRGSAGQARPTGATDCGLRGVAANRICGGPDAATARRPHRDRARLSGNVGPRTNRPQLPFGEASFDLILNRHEAFDPGDVRRLLRTGGDFITQQVGHEEAASMRRLLGLPTEGPQWDLAEAVRQVEAASFSVVDTAEAHPVTRFTDIGALVAYLRTVPWEVPEFEVRRFRPAVGAGPRTLYH